MFVNVLYIYIYSRTATFKRKNYDINIYVKGKLPPLIQATFVVSTYYSTNSSTTGLHVSKKPSDMTAHKLSLLSASLDLQKVPKSILPTDSLRIN